MRNYVIINGTNSLTIPGLAIRELPAISKTLMRNQKEEIDGRDGDIITELGYSAYDKTMTIGLYGSYDINQIIAFFNQKGTIVFSDEDDKYYNFTILEKIDYDKLVKFRTASVRIHCQPFKYPVSETPVEIEAEYVTAEAEDITLNNTGVAPLEIGLKGNTSQETTTGKQLFNVNGTLYDGSTITHYNNGFTLKKSTNRTLAILLPNTLNAGTYTLSTTIVSSTLTDLNKVSFGFRNSGGNVSTVNLDSTGKKAFTTTAQVDRIYVYISTSESDSATITFDNVMLESGSSASNWEEYTGGIPAPNPDFPMPVQVVTGDNTIKVQNANVLPIFDNETTFNGVTCKITNGRIKLTGQVSSGYVWVKFTNGIDFADNTPHPSSKPNWFNQDLLVGSNYTFKAFGTTTKTISWVEKNVDNRPSLLSAGTDVSVTKDLTNTTMSCIAMYLGGTGTQINEEFDLEAVKGTTAPTTYTPHQEQNYEINLGKNLFDKNNVINVNNKILNDSGTEISDGTGGYTKMYIPVKPNTTYTISGMASEGSKRVYYFNSSKTFISRTGAFSPSYNTFTTPSNCYYVDFQYFISGNNFNNYQLEVGSQATTYSEYFTPIELCKISTYQDYLYKSGENWYKHSEIGKVVLDGTQWVSGTSQSTDLYYIAMSVLNISYIIGGYCDNFKFVNDNRIVANVEASSYLTNNQMAFRLGSSKDRLYIKSNNFTDNTALQTWLTTHNTLIYYVLATPTEEQITNAELIEQLNDILNAVSYEDQTNISQENDNMAFILDVSALKKGTDMAVVNNGGNIAAKPIIAVKGNGTLGIYLDNTQMFSLNMTSDITIDTENMEAYDPNTSQLRNRQVTGDYSKFALQPGNNTIKVTGDFTSVTISKYKRWL